MMRNRGMKRLRLGVVGVGHLGSLHAQKYATMSDINLVGVVDVDHKKAREAATKCNTKAFSSHSELISQVDGISLAVPTPSHFDIGYEILNHGVHLLIEKPITLRVGDADRLIEEAKKNGLILQTGHIERFNPVVAKMKALISQPVFIESHRLNRFTERGTDVDVVLDLMIHDLDIVLHLMQSEIREIEAVGMPVVTGKIDFANVRMLFGDGTVANLTASRVSNKSIRTARIFQPDSYVSVDYNLRKIGVTRFISPLNHSVDTFGDSDPLADQVKSFVECIKKGREPEVSGDDGRRALAVALSIVDQIKTKTNTVP